MTKTKFKFLHYTLFLMTLGGTFRIKTRNPTRKLLFNLLRIMMNLILLSFMLSCFIDMRDKGFTRLELVNKHYIYFCNFIDNFYNPNEIQCILGAGIYICFRLNYHYVYDDISSDIAKQIRNMFRYKTEIGFDEKDLRNYVKATNILLLVWIFYGFLLAQIDIWLPIVLKKDRVLALPMWFPFDWKASPYYELVIVMQMIIQQTLLITEYGMNAFFVNTMILTSGQFKLLGWELKHIVHKHLLKSDVELDKILAFMGPPHDAGKIHTDEALLGTLNSKTFRNNLLENLNELADFHDFLLTLSARLNQFFSPVHLVCFCTLLFSVAILEFTVIMAENLMFKLLSVMFVLVGLTMLFLPCYFGNLLTSHAEEVLCGLYDLPWYMCDDEFRTNFKILQQRAGKPVFLKVGKFANLSLETFLWILKVIYSSVTVLRQVTEDS